MLFGIAFGQSLILRLIVLLPNFVIITAEHRNRQSGIVSGTHQGLAVLYSREVLIQSIYFFALRPGVIQYLLGVL